MRCRNHFNDNSSYNGVCASCLRERLYILIAAQTEYNLAQQQDCRQDDATDLENGDDLFPVVCPNSASPGYVSRRQSDCGVIGKIDGENQRFYSTPQVGPNGKLVIGEEGRSYGKRKNGRRISWWSKFRSKSLKNNPGGSDPCRDPDVADTGNSNTSSRNPGWFGKVFSGRRSTVAGEKSTAGGNQGNSRVSDKGVSPTRFTDEEDENWNHMSSGSSSECSMPWNKTPKMTPAWVAPARREEGSNGKSSGHSRNGTGFGFCWSPLVRASPGRHWSRNGISPDVIVSGDLPVVAPKPPSCNVVALCKNRSRKMADFGRFRHHR